MNIAENHLHKQDIWKNTFIQFTKITNVDLAVNHFLKQEVWRNTFMQFTKATDHKCESCSKLFSEAGHLKTHIHTIHEGHKNHKCESFSTKSFSQAQYFSKKTYHTMHSRIQRLHVNPTCFLERLCPFRLCLRKIFLIIVEFVLKLDFSKRFSRSILIVF